jgi:hypothetical protein
MSGDHNMYASGSGDGQRSGWRKRQTIEHMWKVASGDPHHDTNWHDPVVIAFAELVRADEREACIVDIQWHIPRAGRHTPEYQMAMRMIERIRARGQA